MRNRIQLAALPILLACTSWVHAAFFPTVEDVRITDEQLLWSAVELAGGYNIYFSPGGPSKYEKTYTYLATTKDGRSRSVSDPGFYKVVAFNQSGSVFGDIAAAESIWLRPDGSADSDSVTPVTPSGIADSVIQNVRIENDLLLWDAIPNAGGYNIYFTPNGPSKYSVTYDYLSTVKNTTSYSGLQPGMYRVVAFNRTETIYANIVSAQNIWLRTSGDVDDGTSVYSQYGSGSASSEADGTSGSDITEAVVQNVRIEGNQLRWSDVAGAGGYNIYYHAGGPSKYGVSFDYLTTVKNATSFTGVAAGMYKVVPFSADETTFGQAANASIVYLLNDGEFIVFE